MSARAGQYIVRVLLPNGEKTVVRSKITHKLKDVRNQVWQKKEAAFDGYKDGCIFRLLHGEILFNDDILLSYVAKLCAVFYEAPPKSTIIDLFLIKRSDQSDREKRQFKRADRHLPVTKQGYLQKQGGGRVGEVNKFWKKRYCVLQSQTLFWYDDEETCLSDLPANNCVSMGSVYAVPDASNTKKTFSFRLEANHIFKRSFSLAAYSKDELDEWVECITTNAFRRIKSVLVTIGESLLQNGGIENEGLFRVSGKKDSVDELMKRFDTGEFPFIEEFKQDCHVLSGVYKQALRHMPVPLLTFEHYRNFVKLGNKSVKDIIPKLAHEISELPYTNQALLRYILFFVNQVATKSDVNMMTSNNLSIVFAPNILRQEDTGITGDASALMDNEMVLNVVDKMIVNCEEIFEILETQYWPVAAEARQSSASIAAFNGKPSFSPPSSPPGSPVPRRGPKPKLPPPKRQMTRADGGISYGGLGSNASSPPGFRSSRVHSRAPIRSKTTIPIRSSVHSNANSKKRSKSPPPKPSVSRTRIPPRKPTIQNSSNARDRKRHQQHVDTSQRHVREIDQLNSKYKSSTSSHGASASWSKLEKLLSGDSVPDNMMSNLNDHLIRIEKSIKEAIEARKALDSFLEKLPASSSFPASSSSGSFPASSSSGRRTISNGVGVSNGYGNPKRASTLPPRQSVSRVKKVSPQRTGPSVRQSTASVARRAISPGGSRKKKTAIALFDYQGGHRDDELLFSEDDIIEIIDNPSSGGGWWYGKKQFKEGWFPEKYVELQ